MRYYKLLCYIPFLLGFQAMLSQEVQVSDTVTLSRANAEALFLQQNISLISEQLNIDKAKANLIQARLWPNPTFALDEVNLWTTQSGTNNESYFGEELPPLIGDWGRSRHFTLQLEQLVQTAGKRKKMIAMEEVSANIAEVYFEDLLRNLKIEFRNDLTELQYLQFYATTFTGQLESVRNLVNAYKNQLDQGNISRGEYIRLKALELELLNEINDIHKETISIQKELKILLNLPFTSYLKIDSVDFVPDPSRWGSLNLFDLQNAALQMRPDLQVASLEETYNDNRYSYERAQRIPDLNFSAGYDRGGNFLLDFVGFGVSFDLPIFNRNQGNIEHARLSLEQSELLTAQKRNEIQIEVEAAYRNFIATRNLYETIDASYEEDLQQLLESYTRNFTERNISMLEYMDFMDAYLENIKIILETRKQLRHSYEEIQYLIGSEIP